MRATIPVRREHPFAASADAAGSPRAHVVHRPSYASGRPSRAGGRSKRFTGRAARVR
jgi:hypothetical protein